MTRYLPYAAFAVGLAAVCWVGAGYLGTNPLALAITALVGAFYLMGALELHRFQQATATLARAMDGLTAAPAHLDPWLGQLHPSLQNAARLRIEGERVALPGPAMTPYLAGLLVLLGMLGTFLGMVVTLNGTGAALTSAADLQAVRASLAEPVRGLGLAFGTSVAGVAASAMLGLVSALCRRDRLQAAQRLDAQIATTLRPFSLAHRRDESFRLLQQQTELMPALVDRLQHMMGAMHEQSQALHARLVAGQDSFHGKAEATYASLAASVDRSLKESLQDSARAAGATLQPVVEATMAGIAREASALHASVGESAQRQLETLSQRFDAQSAALLRTVNQAHEDLQAGIAARDQERLDAWTQALEATGTTLRDAWQQAGARSEAQQQEICNTLAQTAREVSAHTETQARQTIAEIAQLMQAAAEAPRAAAEVIAELREKLAGSMARDNAMLEERGRILESLQTLLGAVNQASAEQRAAIDALVGTSADLLERVGARFTDQVDAETGKLAQVAAQVTGSAVEVASLGEAFGFGVQLFSQSNETLVAHLQRIEGALGKSIARSDEQLEYYVAQAREVIDLSIMSQKQIVEDLQQLAHRQASVATAA